MSSVAAIDDAGRDDTVRALILTGAGERAFVAGADINELAVQTPVGGREHARRGQALFDRIERLGKPVIAAVNGFALGGGCELAMACTMRLAADYRQARPAGDQSRSAARLRGLAASAAARRSRPRARAAAAGPADHGRGSVADRTRESRGARRRSHDRSARRSRRRWRPKRRSPCATSSMPSPAGSR